MREPERKRERALQKERESESEREPRSAEGNIVDGWLVSCALLHLNPAPAQGGRTHVTSPPEGLYLINIHKKYCSKGLE